MIGAAVSDARMSGAPVSAAPLDLPGALNMMSKKILLVDDDVEMTRMAQMTLEKEGHTVITAAGGQEALERVAAEKPDLVVMDVMMPEMDGFELLDKLKEDAATAGIPTIMLSARGEYSNVLKGREAGVDFYIPKPYNPYELTGIIRRIFDDEPQTI